MLNKKRKKIAIIITLLLTILLSSYFVINNNEENIDSEWYSVWNISDTEWVIIKTWDNWEQEIENDNNL